MEYNHFNSQSEFEKKLEELTRENERRRLEKLRQKYTTPPDYSNMSLQDELQTRFDLDEMNNLAKKFGAPKTPTTPVSPQPAPMTPISSNGTGFANGISQPQNRGAYSHPYNQNQTVTPQGRIMQQAMYLNHSPKPFPMKEVMKSGLTGFGEGVKAGALTAVNGVSTDGFDLLNYFVLDNAYEKRQQEMQARAEEAGLGGVNKLANWVTENASEAYLGGKIGGAFKKYGLPLINKFK